MKRFVPSSLLLAALCCLARGSGTAWAEVFVLQNGGEVHGQWVNAETKNAEQYVVNTPSGGVVRLDRDQVKQITKQSEAETEYDKLRAQYANTVEGQWALAEWCRKNKLPQQRKTHLERVVELDPDHAEVRRALGYAQIHGRWVTQDNFMRDQGYVRYKNQWRLPQEVELIEKQHKEEIAYKAWAQKIARWRKWLDSDKAPQARESFQAIDDPYAIVPLAHAMSKETARDAKLLYIETLARLKAFDALVKTAVYDSDEEVRLSCLEALSDAKYRPAVSKFILALRDQQNSIVNRAGVALGTMKDPTAVGPLIDALVTRHKIEIARGNPNQMNATFGTGQNQGSMPGAFSFGGGGPQIIEQDFQNRDVLQALIDLSGGVNFNFDVPAWKYWYAAQKKSQSIDARRD